MTKNELYNRLNEVLKTVHSEDEITQDNLADLEGEINLIGDELEEEEDLDAE